MLVELGIQNAKETYKTGPNDEDRGVRVVEGLRVLLVNIPADVSLSEAFTTITHHNGVHANHSDDAPNWVHSDSDGLASLLAEHYGCAKGKPADLEDTHWTFAGPPGVHPAEV